MIQAWLVVGAVGVTTFAIKALGPVLLGGRPLPPKVGRMVALLGPALLAALVAVNTLGGDNRLVVDSRLLGVAAGGVAIWAKLPPLAVVVVAAAVTALARAAAG